MKDEIEILLRLCEEQWNHIRHLEDQRAAFTNLVTVVTAGILGFVIQQKLSKESLPLTILLIVLGISGAIASTKFHERYRFHRNKALYWLKRINELSPGANFLELNEVAEKEHKRMFPKASKLHVHALWITFHILIASLGFVATLVIII